MDDKIPRKLESVLAEIRAIGELGKSKWYEVVYHDGDKWCCYAGSKTFEDGEKVERWKYIEQCFSSPNTEGVKESESRLSKAERALLKIDNLYDDNSNASKIVSDYFNSLPTEE
jgi:hypothetical protein